MTHKLPAEVEFCKRSIVVMNCAGWHRAKDLVVPANIEILYLPPYYPKLNPAERLWEHLYASIMFSSFLIV
ncbi:MAG: transposase [Rickettsia endosymbiont of Labidopullus appendiculatus]|nr:transposase [Rickettsia endosymbiont of Labidopullus appendiculatus]